MPALTPQLLLCSGSPSAAGHGWAAAESAAARLCPSDSSRSRPRRSCRTSGGAEPSARAAPGTSSLRARAAAAEPEGGRRAGHAASPQPRTCRRLAGRAPPALPALPGRAGADGGGLFRLPAEATSLAGRARSQSVSAARPRSPPGQTPPGLRAPRRAGPCVRSPSLGRFIRRRRSRPKDAAEAAVADAAAEGALSPSSAPGSAHRRPGPLALRSVASRGPARPSPAPRALEPRAGADRFPGSRRQPGWPRRRATTTT